MTEFNGTIDLSSIETRLDAMLAKLTAIEAKIETTTPPGNENPPDPPAKQKWGVNGRKFTKDGVDIPILKGASCRPIAYHIKSTPSGELIHRLPDHVAYFTNLAHLTDVDDTLNRAVAMGCHVIRFYAAIQTHPNGTLGTDTAYCIERTREMVNYIANRGMGALLVLNCTSSPFHVYPAPQNIDWYKSGYKGAYLDFVTAVVNAFKDNQDVFGFEIINEAHSYQPFGTNEAEIMLAFMVDMAARVKALAPNRLVLPGNESAHQLFAHLKSTYFPKLLAAKFDAVSVHLYDPTPTEALGTGTKLGAAPNQVGDYEFKQTQKPLLIGEFGVSRQGASRNAAPITQEFLSHVKGLGAAGVLQWALVQARQEGGNIGWHDAASMDNCEHLHDWAQLFTVWSNFK